MALNRPDNLFDSINNKVPGPSGRWIGQEPTPVVSTVVKNVNNNISVQTGEEFSKKFLQDRLPVRKVTAVANGNQNSQLAYEDLTCILGLRRMDSECASETSEFVSAKGSSKEVDAEAYVDKLSRSNKENGDTGHGLGKAFSDLNCDRAGGTNVSPNFKSESPHSNNINGSVSDSSQSGKVKFLCSFGGKILPRPVDGRLRFVGGETRIVSIRKNVSWNELVKRTSSICSQPHTIKYQLPGEDLDALISVSSDEDLQNMIEEYNGIEQQDGSQRLRIFLIPLGECENTSLEGSTSQQNNHDYQYVAAVNGMVDASPREGGQNLAGEASQVGAKTSQFPSEINSDSNALNPNKFSESPNIIVSPTQSPPFSPVPCPQGDSKTVQIKSHGNSSRRGSNETNCSSVSTQLPPQNASTKIGGTNPPPEVVNLMNYHQPGVVQSEQLRGGQFHDHNPGKDFVSPSVVGQNDGEFEGFFNDRSVCKERIFHSEKPSARPEDPISLLADYGDSHQGMPHAFSDSKLQESGRKSAYCSQEGVSLSSPLAYAKAQLSLLLNPGTLQETTSQLHDNTNAVNRQVQTNLLDDGSVGLQSGNLPNSSVSLESMGWNEPTLQVTGDIHNNFQTANDNLIKSDSTLPSQSEEDSLNLVMIKRRDEMNPFLDQDDKVCGGGSVAAGMECKNKLDNLTPNPSPVFTIGSQERLPTSLDINLLPLVDGMMENPKNHQSDNTLSELLTMNKRTSNDQDYCTNGKLDGQGNVLGAMNSEVSSLFPTARQQHRDLNPLGDLLSGLSSDPVFCEPTQLHPVASNMISEPMLISSVNFYQLPHNVDPGISSNLQKSDQVAQNRSPDSAVKQEVSLLDMDFISYPNQNFEKTDITVSADLNSNTQDITLVQTNLPSNDNNPSVAVTKYLMDETNGDAISPAVTEVDSIVPESDSEVKFGFICSRFLF